MTQTGWTWTDTSWAFAWGALGPVGTLVITANGEDFVRDGFVSEDGWQIDFDTVQVNVQGPNEDAGILAEGAEAQMTFHFDHIFGDFDEGPADPVDEETINFVAIGFGPFAALAEDDSLNMNQAQLQAAMDTATFSRLCPDFST